jgi:hypothetical protein
MDVSSVVSGSNSSVNDLARLLKEVNQMQMDMVRNILQVTVQQGVVAQEMEIAEEAQGAVDYYA